jgi:putative CocE/NonD family hydrolase
VPVQPGLFGRGLSLEHQDDSGESVRHVSKFPHAVREIEHFFIPMPDGTRLAARMWLPKGAEDAPVPAILEYLPYRKRDLTRARDNLNHPYLAGHGYACLRVDIRGTGESDGVLTDEYTEQELEDGEELIRWISEQPWCNGRVGMMGLSWGGFNALQIAARRPSALKAIIVCCASDDRYRDNMHYMSGCLLGDHLSGATVMFAHNSLPPDPALVGERWREMWMQRLEASGGWLNQWLRNQRRNDYWKHGSVCEDYAAIQCPVFAMSGWADGYTNAVFRLMENLSVPRRAIIGAWGHLYPNEGIPGPAVGFLQESLRWWDHWLKDRDTGMMDEPMLRVWMQDSMPPSSQYAERPGRWIGEPCWPSPNIRERRCTLGQRRLLLDDEPVEEAAEEVRSPLSLGMFGGRWASKQALPDLPSDQRQEDGGALVFDSEKLQEPLEVFGIPTVTLDLAADRPVAQVAVRLVDVLPDGEATQVAFGAFNLAQRDSLEHPQPLTPGERYQVVVGLHGVAHNFPEGHRLRLSVSSSYFPMVWPPPEPVTLTIHSGASYLSLPERPHRAEDDQVQALEPPEGAPPLATEQITPAHESWEIKRDQIRNLVTQEVITDKGVYCMPDIDLRLLSSDQEHFHCQGEDFASPSGTIHTQREFERDGWHIRVETRTKLTSTKEEFWIHAQLDAYEGDERVFSRNWHEGIPRDLL